MLVVIAALASLPPARWVLGLALNHFRLQWGAVPLSEALLDPGLSAVERERILLVEPIEQFGERELGFQPTRNYERINLGFTASVWNVSACAADRFHSRQWWYPVVGTLPYTGFFSEGEAQAEVERLQALGWEAWRRPAGAYSTLGWFRDPLWRSMLAGSEGDLANLVLHELAHATLWLPDHGAFNESFATFLGDEATERFLAHLEDQRPGVAAAWANTQRDRTLWVDHMHNLWRRLSALYAAALPFDALAAERRRVFEDARNRLRAASFTDARWAMGLDDESQWNNARLVQFRVYHQGAERFEAALERYGGDLRLFLAAARPALKQRVANGEDPYAVLASLGTAEAP